jgi:acyl-CoA reductase-like NAD-dependent aldehyde dehydrogenase
VTNAAAAAWAAQPLWSLVPVSARARYVRRAAVAMLDELDDLALRLVDETGWPRAHLVLSELLPAARGLRVLADDGPQALADRRVSARVARLAGTHTRLVHSPVGVVGLRGPSASPWAEPALEAGAALLAGNGVLVCGGALPQRLRGVFLRAGVPGELIAPVPADALEACRRVVDLPPPSRRGILLVLGGAPRAKVVEAAVWAAFGRHSAAAGRLITVAGAVPGLLEALTAGAAALRVGDPRDPETDVGPLARAEDASGLPGEPVTGLDGVFWRPTVVGVRPDDPLFRSPPPGPILAVVEAPDTETAIALAAAEGREGPVSVWARDLAQGERVARRLPSEVTWIGRHGEAPTAVAVRLARHVVARQVETRAAWARGTPRLPAEAGRVAAESALAEFRHGREARRWPALRALVRTAWRER